jgi:hypothetical protein
MTGSSGVMALCTEPAICLVLNECDPDEIRASIGSTRELEEF